MSYQEASRRHAELVAAQQAGREMCGRVELLGLCVQYLASVGARVANAVLNDREPMPYVLLSDPGRLPDVLDQAQARYVSTDSYHMADVHGCVVSWSTAERAG